MKARSLLWLLPAVFTVAALWLLLRGSDLLGVLITRHFPFGTLITWLGLVSWALLWYLSLSGVIGRQNGRGRWFRNAFRAAIGLNAAWGLISYGLAGDWFFNFSNTAPRFQNSPQAFSCFLVLTATAVLLPVALAISYGIYRLIQKKHGPT